MKLLRTIQKLLPRRKQSRNSNSTTNSPISKERTPAPLPTPVPQAQQNPPAPPPTPVSLAQQNLPDSPAQEQPDDNSSVSSGESSVNQFSLIQFSELDLRTLDAIKRNPETKYLTKENRDYLHNINPDSVSPEQVKKIREILSQFRQEENKKYYAINMSKKEKPPQEVAPSEQNESPPIP